MAHAWMVGSVKSLEIFILVLHVFPLANLCLVNFIKIWYHDGKRIVPVTVQVWDCLSSPLRTPLVRKRVDDGSVGAIDTSKSSGRFLGE
mgnify:CR=1 FL=1